MEEERIITRSELEYKSRVMLPSLGARRRQASAKGWLCMKGVPYVPCGTPVLDLQPRSCRGRIQSDPQALDAFPTLTIKTDPSELALEPVMDSGVSALVKSIRESERRIMRCKAGGSILRDIVMHCPSQPSATKQLSSLQQVSPPTPVQQQSPSRNTQDRFLIIAPTPAVTERRHSTNDGLNIPSSGWTQHSPKPAQPSPSSSSAAVPDVSLSMPSPNPVSASFSARDHLTPEVKPPPPPDPEWLDCQQSVRQFVKEFEQTKLKLNLKLMESITRQNEDRVDTIRRKFLAGDQLTDLRTSREFLEGMRLCAQQGILSVRYQNLSQHPWFSDLVSLCHKGVDRPLEAEIKLLKGIKRSLEQGDQFTPACYYQLVLSLTYRDYASDRIQEMLSFLRETLDIKPKMYRRWLEDRGLPVPKSLQGSHFTETQRIPSRAVDNAHP